MVINQCSFEEEGLSPHHQIALILAELSEALHKKTRPNSIEIQVSVGVQFIAELSKVSALKLLVFNLVKCYYPNSNELPKITGVMGTRYYTSNDSELNLIRQSIQAFSLILAQVDDIQMSSFNQQEKSKRISENIIHLLKEEARLKTLQNPIKGATTLKIKSDEVAQESWTIFQEIEKEGGYSKILSSGRIQQWIKENNDSEVQRYKDKKQVLIGGNKYAKAVNGKIYFMEKQL